MLSLRSIGWRRRSPPLRWGWLCRWSTEANRACPSLRTGSTRTWWSKRLEASYTWSSEDGWAELELPDGVDDMGEITLGDDGRLYATLLHDRAPTLVVRLDSSRWEVIGEFPHRENYRLCVTQGQVHSLAALTDLQPMMDDESVVETEAGLLPSTYAVSSLSIQSGKTRRAVVPEIDTVRATAGVGLGCSDQGPIVANTTGLSPSALAVYESSSDGWKRLDGFDQPYSGLGEFISWGKGALVVAVRFTGGRKKAINVTAFGGDTTRRLDANFENVEIVPLADTGRAAHQSFHDGVAVGHVGWLDVAAAEPQTSGQG